MNTQLAPDDKWYGIPFPGTFVLDAEGRVTARYFEESYRTRLTGRGLALQTGTEAGAAPDSVVRLSGEHLEITVFSSDPVVAPGQEFLVLIDVAASPGVHVYAPGEHPYRAIRFHPAPDSLFSAREAIYPPSRDYHFEPLDERVPVFEGSFRVMQPVVLEASRELATRAKEPGATVTLRGTLEYQACDDKVCFLPDAIPVEITLSLRSLEP